MNPTPQIPNLIGAINFNFLDLKELNPAQLLRYIPNFVDMDVFVAKVKLILFILTVILSFIFMVILMKLRKLILTNIPNASVKSGSEVKLSAGPYRARWTEILNHMESAKEWEWKFAVIEADKLADLVLKRAGFAGESMGDRLVNIQDGQITSLQDLWDAHKVRNNLAHNVDYFLRYTEARRAIEKYQRFLEEMGVI